MAVRDEVTRDLVLGLINQQKLVDAESVVEAYRKIFDEVNRSQAVYGYSRTLPKDYLAGKSSDEE
jgi:hypothetical protein